MLKRNLLIGISLLAFSIIIYSIQINIFHDPHETYFLLFQDLAFLPLEIFLISFILEKYLESKEKQEKLRKIQILVSAFYSEVGTPLINNLLYFNINRQKFQETLAFEKNLLVLDKKRISEIVDNFDYEIDSRAGDLTILKDFLLTKKTYILGMFENPNLLEHDNFTDMLWAIYHVLDELENRVDLNTLPESDLAHLSLDIKRAYKCVLKEWVDYMSRLEQNYPYLFSLAMRKNPFADNDIIIK